MMASNQLYLDLFIHSNNGKQLKCSICDCWLPSGADKFISGHVNGRKHKQQVEKKRKQEEKLQCSVYVKGFDPVLTKLEDELEKYFENMGVKVKDIYIDKNSASYGIIEFMVKEDVDKVMVCEKPLFHDKKLVIKRREVPKKNLSDTSETKAEDTPNSVSCLLPTELQDKMKEQTDLVRQMKLITEFFQLTHEEMLLRNLICQLLENVIEEIYPECKVLLFGSSANGLGEKGCDVDVTLVTDKMNDESTDFAELREVLQRYAPGCKNISVVQSSKTCNIVKFFHTESNLFVDLSLNNYLAINNTELLKAYMSYDERVPLVTFTIRKWAKCFGLSGRNNNQITQYSLTLMVIHFLQQQQPPVLPCLQECHPAEEVMVGQWNCSFCKCEEGNRSENTLTAADLLFEFFKFYASFDFSENIVAIHCTTVLARNEVYKTVNDLNVGDAEKDFKFNSPLVVQDSFKFTHNVTHNLSSDGLLLLVNSFKHACSVRNDADSASFSLTQLFIQSGKCSTRQKQKRKRNRSNIYTISLPNCRHISDRSEVECFEYVKTILVEDLRMRISELDVKLKVTDIKSSSQDKTSTSLQPFVVTNGLKRNSDELEAECVPSKKLKTESTESINFVATAYADTWTNRRKQRRLIQKLQRSDDTAVDVSHDTNEDADSGILMSDTSTSNSVPSNIVNETENHALLHFNVNITNALNDHEICKLKLQPLDDSKNLQDFQTFYAYIKKELIAVFK